jgi:hypothetical protein
MPGKRITDHQVHKYKQHRTQVGQSAAAAKAGISERSARRIESASELPSQRPPRSWRTRADPISEVWEAEVVPLLQADPMLQSVAVLQELEQRHSGRFGPQVLRTLQRRMRLWRAQFGAEREVFFAQEHPPGRQGLSDFTVCDSLSVHIAGEPFAHRLYQFALAHSGWRHVSIVTTGESFMALSDGLQAALWALGGVPEEHRTDSLSAAFNNLADEQTLNKRYEALCEHYGLRASRCNPGQSNENGSIESRHASLKNALDQALRLRAGRSFSDLAEYEAFVQTVVSRMNERVAARLGLERKMLRPLPKRRTAEFEELSARVSKYAVFSVKGVLYSAPSQLIGHRLSVRLYGERLECWLSGKCVLSTQRAVPSHTNGKTRARRIDYRHLVGALKRKPQALARWVLRDEVFPSAVYYQTWQRLSAQRPEREACKTMVGLLCLAAQGHEAQLAAELEQLIELDQLPNLQALTALLAPPKGELPCVEVVLPALSSYDTLMQQVLA